MLKILADSLEYDKYLKGTKFVDFVNPHFNRVKKVEWFEHEFVKKNYT